MEPKIQRFSFSETTHLFSCKLHIVLMRPHCCSSLKLKLNRCVPVVSEYESLNFSVSKRLVRFLKHPVHYIIGCPIIKSTNQRESGSGLRINESSKKKASNTICKTQYNLTYKVWQGLWPWSLELSRLDQMAIPF